MTKNEEILANSPINNKEVPNKLNVTVYSQTEPLNDTLSKSRVRIFYKGMNRNRTFISEDFANQLISSLPYTPIKGIFDKDSLDYTDHGNDNADGRIYGIVPAEPNFAWEQHEDEDGIVRTYACADVYLFTGLYQEAKLIVGKSQSMEIFRNTLQGEWKKDEYGDPYYHFIKGSLVGLQVLGDFTEPCFEGAEFFSLYKELKDLKDLIEKFTYNNNKEKEVGKSKMEKFLFKLSDAEKADKIFDLLNPEFNKVGGWKMEWGLVDVYEDYALCGNQSGFMRVYYTKTGDSIELGEKVPVKIVDVTETEYSALESIRDTSGNYEAAEQQLKDNGEKIETLENSLNELKQAKEDLSKQNEEFQKTISEKDTQIADYENKVNVFENEKVEMSNKISDLQNENKILSDFKIGIETQQKQAILTKYEEYLNDSTISSLNDKINSMSVEDFKKEVCTAAVESDSTIFSNRKSDVFYKGGSVEEDGKEDSGILKLLNKHKNGGSK